MKKPLVSIVMPVWNGQKYLSEAAQSVLGQSYENFELIVVNDASTDSTPEILAEIEKQDPRITVITNSKNLKLPASLNVGFQLAKGDWFTWISDDNIMEKECIQLLLSNALKRDSKFVFSDYKIIDESGEFLGVNQTGPGELIYLENTIGACFLYHREVGKKLRGYSEDKFMFEDYDFWVRAHRSGYTLDHIENISPYKYRIHKNQLSHTTKLPKEFIYYRYELITNLKTRKLKSRAYLSVLHLSITHRLKELAFFSGAKLFLANPFLGLYSVIQAWRRRTK